MPVDICATCGEEHEPPRGSKCKRAKLGKRPVKTEAASSGEEELETEKAGRSARRDGERGDSVVEDYEEDDEERELRRLVSARARERRKKALRAVLDEGSPEEELAVAASTVKPTKKKAGKKKEDADPDESPSDTSSDDDSGSDSESSRRRRRRRKRSKFALNKYTINEKRLKKVTVMELVYAALVWGMKRGKQAGFDYEDLERYIGHVAYMCMHASTSTYVDQAYRGYDKAIREKVKEKGLKSFVMGDPELSLQFFNLDNKRSSRDSYRPARTGYVAKSYDNTRRLCYSYNYNKEGCTLRTCNYEHKCLNCRTMGHPSSECKSKKN